MLLEEENGLEGKGGFNTNALSPITKPKAAKPKFQPSPLRPCNQGIEIEIEIQACACDLFNLIPQTCPEEVNNLYF